MNGSLVWTMSRNRERWHSQLRRVGRTASRAKWSLWLLAQRSVTVEHACLCMLYHFKKATLTCICKPWHRSYQGYLHYTNLAISGGCLSVSVTWWVCWWTIQTFAQSSMLEKWLCPKQTARFHQWPYTNVVSWVVVPSTHLMPKNRGRPWSGKIGCNIP